MCNKMSDVRLSNASPTVERVDARQPDAARPSVRRNLFGTPDREEIRRYVEATIEEDVQRLRDEYNFDPVRERPLSPRGAYEWEVDHDAPEFFLRQPHGSQRPRRDAGPEDGEEGSDGRTDGRRSRKRRSGDSGPCSSECQSKMSHTDRGDDDDDGDGDEDKPGGAASQAVKSAEESSVEVQ